MRTSYVTRKKPERNYLAFSLSRKLFLSRYQPDLPKNIIALQRGTSESNRNEPRDKDLKRTRCRAFRVWLEFVRRQIESTYVCNSINICATAWRTRVSENDRSRRARGRKGEFKFRRVSSSIWIATFERLKYRQFFKIRNQGITYTFRIVSRFPILTTIILYSTFYKSLKRNVNIFCTYKIDTFERKQKTIYVH